MSDYELSRIAAGFVAQREPLGNSNDIDALKECANDELLYSGSHRWVGKWYTLKGEWYRSWKTFSGRHGGSYQIRKVTIS